MVKRYELNVYYPVSDEVDSIPEADQAITEAARTEVVAGGTSLGEEGGERDLCFWYDSLRERDNAKKRIVRLFGQVGVRFGGRVCSCVIDNEEG